MYKIRKITFIEHPILKNLSLDFCDANGDAVDTIIFAGENGTGKSTILNELYKVASHTISNDCDVEINEAEKDMILHYRMRNHINGKQYMYISNGSNINGMIISEEIKNKLSFNGIFSDVDINFHSNNISNVTSLTLDSIKGSRKSAESLPTQINQLIVDVQAEDDADIARAVKDNPSIPYEHLKVNERIPRFTKAFNRMFDNLTYSHVSTEKGRKVILFQKYGKNVPINDLSSGEKQIVYRGCFLLKDVNAINGAFVFIDEPEISLHPSWQTKVMDYYKGIFTNGNGQQTSQIFAVTHSPFIIHNENRRNDKVIVLDHDDSGNIIIKTKQEYLKCTSVEAVQDAFHIPGFSGDKATVYLEGRTDEKYFKKALSVFEYVNLPFEFKWIGYLDANEKEVNTGKDALNKAFHFLIARNVQIKNICLFDCDTKRKNEQHGNVYIRVLPTFDNSKKIKIGIENALILDEVDIRNYYTEKEKVDEYGANSIIRQLDKMKLCDYICTMSNEQLKKVFSNLKQEIDSLRSFFQ